MKAQDSVLDKYLSQNYRAAGFRSPEAMGMWLRFMTWMCSFRGLPNDEAIKQTGKEIKNRIRLVKKGLNPCG